MPVGPIRPATPLGQSQSAILEALLQRLSVGGPQFRAGSPEAARLPIPLSILATPEQAARSAIGLGEAAGANLEGATVTGTPPARLASATLPGAGSPTPLRGAPVPAATGTGAVSGGPPPARVAPGAVVAPPVPPLVPTGTPIAPSSILASMLGSGSEAAPAEHDVDVSPGEGPGND